MDQDCDKASGLFFFSAQTLEEGLIDECCVLMLSAL